MWLLIQLTFIALANALTHASSATQDADGEEALSPYDTTQMHLEDVEHIESEILAAKEAGQPIVILTHHGPLMEFGCSNPEFWTSPIRNAFACVPLYLSYSISKQNE
jgi:hypothetical protein